MLFGLLPDTNSVILVTANALSLNDDPDWFGQLIIEEFVDVPEPERNDFVALAKFTTTTNLEWFPKLSHDLEKDRVGSPSSRDINEYVGVYRDSIHVFEIHVFVKDSQLYWALQGLKSEIFPLTSYESDTFTWLIPRNDLSSLG